VEAMLQSKCHIIATMRSKMDYIQTEDGNGKKRIEKVGMAPIQRAGMEYEFDVVGDMDLQHNLVITKSRCFAIADQVVNKPTAKWFDTLRAWLGSGAPMIPPTQPVILPKPQPARPTAPPQILAHWIDDTLARERFWGWTKTELLMSEADVYAALGVEHIHEYQGGMADAKAAILAWVKAKRQPEAAILEQLAKKKEEVK